MPKEKIAWEAFRTWNDLVNEHWYVEMNNAVEKLASQLAKLATELHKRITIKLKKMDEKRADEVQLEIERTLRSVILVVTDAFTSLSYVFATKEDVNDAIERVLQTMFSEEFIELLRGTSDVIKLFEEIVETVSRVGSSG